MSGMTILRRWYGKSGPARTTVRSEEILYQLANKWQHLRSDLNQLLQSNATMAMNSLAEISRRSLERGYILQDPIATIATIRVLARDTPAC